MTRYGRRSSWLGALVVAVGVLVAIPVGASAAVVGTHSGGMTVNAGAQRLSLISSRSTTDGRLQSKWLVGGKNHVTVTGAPGSAVTIGQGELLTVEVTPPGALAGEAAARGPRAKRGPLAHAAWTNPCNHCWFNAQSAQACARTCVYAGSNQYALQEVPGAWYMGQHITGTVHPGSGTATLGEAYARFPGESGDSGPIGFKPSGDHCPNSGDSWSWSFSFGGFTFGDSGPLSAGSCYGPIAPSGWGMPAFGSRWWSNGQSGNHSIGSFDAVNLGPGQDPWDVLYVAAN